MRPLDFADAAAERYADRVGLIDNGAQYTYNEINAISHRMARGLLAAGFPDQARAAVYSRSHPRVLLSVLAIMRAGGIVVPVNAAASAEASAAFLKHVRPNWLFYQPGARQASYLFRSQIPELAQTVCLGDHCIDGLSVGQWMRDPDGANVYDWADACGNPTRPVTIVPTGGTTGDAKAVTIRTSAYTTYIETYRRFLRYDDDFPVCLTASQLTPASLGMAFVMLTLGACQIVMPTFSATEVLSNIQQLRVTHLWLPATALYALMTHPAMTDFDLSSIRMVVIGGSAVAPEVLKRAIQVFGPCVCHSYGQIETGILAWLDGGTIARALGGDHAERLRSCGRIHEAMQVAIVSSDGGVMPSGVTGEVVARGRGVSEYYNDPELTTAVRRDGWHHTGDLGYIDASGYLFIVGRLKDVIITGGCNVYPLEVETVLLELPDVQECAVVGKQDTLFGEMVSAVIVRRPSHTLTREQVVAHCRIRLGGVKSPKHIEFLEDLPKTAAGKIDRNAIRRRISAGEPSPAATPRVSGAEDIR